MKSPVIEPVGYISRNHLLNLSDYPWDYTDTCTFKHGMHNVANARTDQRGDTGPFQDSNAFRCREVFDMEFIPCQLALTLDLNE